MEHFVLEVYDGGIEWHFLIQKLLDLRNSEVLIKYEEGMVIYMFPRTHYSAGELAKMIGQPERLVEIAPKIRLHPLSKGFPAPTVGYYGEA